MTCPDPGYGLSAHQRALVPGLVGASVGSATVAGSRSRPMSTRARARKALTASSSWSDPAARYGGVSASQDLALPEQREQLAERRVRDRQVLSVSTETTTLICLPRRGRDLARGLRHG